MLKQKVTSLVKQTAARIKTPKEKAVEKPLSGSPLLPGHDDECHKKVFYDLPSIQAKLGYTQEYLEERWATRLPETPVFLIEKDGRKHFVSNYTA